MSTFGGFVFDFSAFLTLHVLAWSAAWIHIHIVTLCFAFSCRSGRAPMIPSEVPCVGRHARVVPPNRVSVNLSFCFGPGSTRVVLPLQGSPASVCALVLVPLQGGAAGCSCQSAFWSLNAGAAGGGCGCWVLLFDVYGRVHFWSSGAGASARCCYRS